MFPGLLWALQAVRKWDRVVWEDGTVRHLPPISLSVDFCTQGFTLYVPFFSNCCIGVFSFSCATLHPWPSFGDPFFGSFFAKNRQGVLEGRVYPICQFATLVKSQKITTGVAQSLQGFLHSWQAAPSVSSAVLVQKWCDISLMLWASPEWCCLAQQKHAEKKTCTEFSEQLFSKRSTAKASRKTQKKTEIITQKKQQKLHSVYFPLGKSKRRLRRGKPPRNCVNGQLGDFLSFDFYLQFFMC